MLIKIITWPIESDREMIKLLFFSPQIINWLLSLSVKQAAAPCSAISFAQDSASTAWPPFFYRRVFLLISVSSFYVEWFCKSLNTMRLKDGSISKCYLRFPIPHQRFGPNLINDSTKHRAQGLVSLFHRVIKKVVIR